MQLRGGGVNHCIGNEEEFEQLRRIAAADDTLWRSACDS